MICPRNIYVEAKYYYEAAHMMEDSREEGKLFPPIIMNAAFACELYSKAILYHEDADEESLRTHGLKDLYEKIPCNIKTLIIDGYKNSAETRFEKFIDDINDIFEFWRYRYEYKEYSAHYSFVLDYMDILNMVTTNMFDGEIECDK